MTVDLSERLAKAQADLVVAEAEYVVCAADIREGINRSYDEAWLGLYGPDREEGE